MPRLSVPLLALALAGATAPAQRPAPYPVSFPRADGHTVPVTVYPPADSCRGIAIISPGAGGSEKGYGYLGQGMSAMGYLAVVVGHEESGLRALRAHIRGRGLSGGLEALITDPGAYDGRFMDIAASRAWAGAHCRAAESILLGHSMGAATVMIEAGAANKLNVHGADAFDVYVAMSPQGVGSIFPDHAWRHIAKPMLVLTGTRDTELGGLSWQTRLQPFQDMPPGCKWQGVIDGATHMDFGRGGATGAPGRLALRTIAAFLDAVHRRDCGAPAAMPGITLQAK